MLSLQENGKQNQTKPEKQTKQKKEGEIYYEKV
jgi:hypothetical protein